MKRMVVRGSGRVPTPAETAFLLAERAAGAETSHDLACLARTLRSSDLPPPERERVERAIAERSKTIR